MCARKPDGNQEFCACVLGRDDVQIGVYGSICSNPTFFTVKHIPTSEMVLIAIVNLRMLK